MGGLAELGEAEVYGENGLGHAVVKFAADAAALLVLKFEEFGGELVDGALGVFEVGDVGEGGDDAEQGAVRIELWNCVAEDPEDFGSAWNPVRQGGLAKGTLGAEDGRDRAVRVGDVVALLVKGDDIELAGCAADDLLARDVEHIKRGLICEFKGAIGPSEDDPGVKIADKCAETLFAFAEGFDGAMLLGEIGEREEDIGDFTGGDELGDDIEQGAIDLLGRE